MEPQTPSDATPIDWQRLDPLSIKIGRLGGAMWTAGLGFVALVSWVVTFVVREDPGVLAWFAAIGIVLGVAGLAWMSWVLPAMRYRYTRYRLDHLGLLVHRGRLFRSEIAVLRSRIQHSDVNQGPIERAFGLATLSIHTAGVSDSAISLAGIPLAEARRLRSELTGLHHDVV
jgi:uncharacterized protein